MIPKPPKPPVITEFVATYRLCFGSGQNAVDEMNNKANDLMSAGFRPFGGIAIAIVSGQPVVAQSFVRGDRNIETS